MHIDYFGLLDASQLLQLYETFIRLLVGIVILGIAAEVICLLLMWLVEPAASLEPFARRKYIRRHGSNRVSLVNRGFFR